MIDSRSKNLPSYRVLTSRQTQIVSTIPYARVGETLVQAKGLRTMSPLINMSLQELLFVDIENCASNIAYKRYRAAIAWSFCQQCAHTHHKIAKCCTLTSDAQNLRSGMQGCQAFAGPLFWLGLTSDRIRNIRANTIHE